MPHTVNGFGTWYWGRSNLHTRMGTCSLCGAYGRLTSYNTTLFFVAMFIPVFPLKRKRVMDECPACRKHLALEQSKWEEIRNKAVADAVAAAVADPNSEQKALDLLGTTMSFRSDEAFVRAAELVKMRMKGSAAVQTALAQGYAFFARPTEAAEAYTRSLSIKLDPEVVSTLVLLLLRQGLVKEAEAYTRPMLAAGQRDKVGLNYLVVEAYQAAAQHDDAQRALADIVRAFPEIEGETEFLNYRRTSQRSPGKRIKPVNLRPIGDEGQVKTSFASMVPRLIPPALLVLAVVIYVSVAVSEGRSRTVWFVSGLQRPYEVEVAGRHTSVGRRVAAHLEIPEGEWTMHVTGEDIHIEPQTVKIETPIWKRPFLKKTFVINPDRTGVVVTGSCEFSKNVAGAHGPSEVEHLGEVQYAFDDMDYVFMPYPSEISVSDTTVVVKKTRVGLPEAQDDPGSIPKAIARGGLTAFLRHRVACDPREDMSVLACSALMSPDEFVAMARPRLADRPVRVEWHRAYQVAMERSGTSLDLYREYTAQLDKDAGNTALMYLVGRVSPDRTEATRLFKAAAEGKPPLAYGDFAMAYDAMAAGRYDDAIALSRTAQELDPNNLQFKQWELEGLKAKGDYRAMLEQCHLRQARKPHQLQPVEDEVELIASQGDAAGAISAANAWIKRETNNASSSDADMGRLHFQAVAQYAAGNRTEFVKVAAQIPSAQRKFEVALTDGQLEIAAKAVDEGIADSDAAELLLYVAGSMAEREDFAAVHLRAAIEGLKKSTRDERTLAAWLGDKKPSAKDACDMLLTPQQKRVALLALAVRYPADKAAYVEAAKKFDYDHAFPHLFVKNAIEELAK